MNKNFYIAVTICEDGKYYSHIVKVAKSDNLLSKLVIENIVSANICPTKKSAAELVTFWNYCYKKNGTYMFNEPGLF